MKKFTTICVVGFDGSVSKNENRMAHGGVKLCQAKIIDGKFKGRFINSNGHHIEVGKSFDLDVERLENWKKIGSKQ